ncbi:hypothetical protein SAMN04490188_1519 [Pseudomonas kilonensis]|uniref:Uncharacterized protein n=1 Tax=Pseudomonas kilonensis TaxID=132476 RepID=A0ABY0YP69_9PSED|nr:hypothetical protein SAMN04490188_1519 [Pseudomonas kilonensis]
MQLSHRNREQARSHMGSRVFKVSTHDTKPCGSELAREGVGTSNIIAT